jgi:hypothetical protein
MFMQGLSQNDKRGINSEEKEGSTVGEGDEEELQW